MKILHNFLNTYFPQKYISIKYRQNVNETIIVKLSHLKIREKLSTYIMNAYASLRTRNVYRNNKQLRKLRYKEAKGSL